MGNAETSAKQFFKGFRKFLNCFVVALLDVEYVLYYCRGSVPSGGQKALQFVAAVFVFIFQKFYRIRLVPPRTYEKIKSVALENIDGNIGIEIFIMPVAGLGTDCGSRKPLPYRVSRRTRGAPSKVRPSNLLFFQTDGRASSSSGQAAFSGSEPFVDKPHKQLRVLRVVVFGNAEAYSPDFTVKIFVHIHRFSFFSV